MTAIFKAGIGSMIGVGCVLFGLTAVPSFAENDNESETVTLTLYESEVQNMYETGRYHYERGEWALAADHLNAYRYWSRSHHASRSDIDFLNELNKAHLYALNRASEAVAELPKLKRDLELCREKNRLVVSTKP